MEFNNKLKPIKPKIKKEKVSIPTGKMSVFEGSNNEYMMKQLTDLMKQQGINWEWDQNLQQGFKKPTNIIIDENRWEDLKNIHSQLKPKPEEEVKYKIELQPKKQNTEDSPEIENLMFNYFEAYIDAFLEGNDQNKGNVEQMKQEILKRGITRQQLRDYYDLWYARKGMN
jgi:hypothetical protein